MHLIGISHILSDSESSQGSLPNSVSRGPGEEHESSLSSRSNEVDQNETNVVSDSDCEEARIPSDEGLCSEPIEGEACKEGFQGNEFGQPGPETLDPGKEDSAIIPDDLSLNILTVIKEPAERLIEGRANYPFQQQRAVLAQENNPDEKSLNISDDLPTNTSMVIAQQPADGKETDGIQTSDDFVALEKGDGPSILSISLSWESEGGNTLNSTRTIEMNTSFASSPVENI